MNSNMASPIISNRSSSFFNCHVCVLLLKCLCVLSVNERTYISEKFRFCRNNVALCVFQILNKVFGHLFEDCPGAVVIQTGSPGFRHTLGVQQNIFEDNLAHVTVRLGLAVHEGAILCPHPDRKLSDKLVLRTFGIRESDRPQVVTNCGVDGGVTPLSTQSLKLSMRPMSVFLILLQPKLDGFRSDVGHLAYVRQVFYPPIKKFREKMFVLQN